MLTTTSNTTNTLPGENRAREERSERHCSGAGEGDVREPGREKGGEHVVAESEKTGSQRQRFQKVRLLKSQNIRITESKKTQILKIPLKVCSPSAFGKKSIPFPFTTHLSKWPLVEKLFLGVLGAMMHIARRWCPNLTD